MVLLIDEDHCYRRLSRNAVHCRLNMLERSMNNVCTLIYLAFTGNRGDLRELLPLKYSKRAKDAENSLNNLVLGVLRFLRFTTMNLSERIRLYCFTRLVMATRGTLLTHLPALHWKSLQQQSTPRSLYSWRIGMNNISQRANFIPLQLNNTFDSKLEIYFPPVCPSLLP